LNKEAFQETTPKMGCGESNQPTPHRNGAAEAAVRIKKRALQMLWKDSEQQLCP